jgi:phage terminase Nu1 subunit (DNA packaging protein)
MTDKYLTITQYAEHQGVSQERISKLKKDGRLVMEVVNGKSLVNVEASDVKIMETAGQSQSLVQGTSKSSLALFSGGTNAERLINATVHEKEYKALQQEMMFKKECGELVEVERVKLAFGAIGAELRQALERLPDRLADQLATMSNATEIHKVLSVEFDQMLLDLVARLNKFRGVTDEEELDHA